MTQTHTQKPAQIYTQTHTHRLRQSFLSSKLVSVCRPDGFGCATVCKAEGAPIHRRPVQSLSKPLQTDQLTNMSNEQAFVHHSLLNRCVLYMCRCMSTVFDILEAVHHVVCSRIRTHPYAHLHTPMCTPTRTHTHPHAHAHAHTHTHTHSYIELIQ